MFLSKNEVIKTIREYCEEQFDTCTVEELKILYKIREDLCKKIKKIETRESDEIIAAVKRLTEREENLEKPYNSSSSMALAQEVGDRNGYHECAS